MNGLKNLSDSVKKQNNKHMTTRRGFAKAWATSWGGAFKTATHNEDYPLKYNNLQYKLTESGGLNTLLLCMLPDTPEVPEGISFAQFDNRQINKETSTKKIIGFSKENAVTHLFWDCDYAPKGALPPCPAIILNAPDDFVAKQPCLFLFTEDQALSKGDMLGQVVRNQKVEADLYVGRIYDGLADADSPTWIRLKMFIDQ